ncbi:MAG: hypothetical protein AAGA56_15960 [Myxococcota bacterium]
MSNGPLDFLVDDDDAPPPNADGTPGEKRRYTRKVRDALRPVDRQPFDYSEIRAVFLNGEDLNATDASGGVDVAAAPGAQHQNTVASSTHLELIHFGRVYRDAQAKFGHDEVDDVHTVELDEVVGGHAIAHRAALQRELLLLSGYIKALQSAMVEAGKAPPSDPGRDGAGMGALSQMFGMIGGLVGGSVSPAVQTSTLDLDPLLAEAEAIAEKLDTDTIEYGVLHECGVALHELRAKYQTFIREQQELLPTGADPAAAQGSLTNLPFIGDVIKDAPYIGDILGWGPKVAGVSLGLLARLAIELQVTMENNIDEACRALTVDAIRQRRGPVFSAWFRPPPVSESDVSESESPGATDPLSQAVSGVQSQVNRGVDQVAGVFDLFQVETVSTPGDPFIDRAFQFDRSAAVHMRMAGAGALGQSAVQVVLRVVDEASAPAVVGQVVGYVFQLVSEFVRSLYTKLLVVGHGAFTEASVIEAGRHHFVDALLQIPFDHIDALGYLENLDFSVPLPGRDPIAITGPGLIGMLKKLLHERLSFLDGAVAYAMKDVAAELSDARRRAGRESHTMELYLAVMPALHARLFRNILLPFWGALEGAINGALAQALSGVTGSVTGVMGTAHNVVHYVDQYAGRAQDLARGGEVRDIIERAGAGFEAVDQPWAEETATPSAFGTLFVNRKTAATASVTESEIQAVEAKWNPDAPANEEEPNPGASGEGDTEETASMPAIEAPAGATA